MLTLRGKLTVKVDPSAIAKPAQQALETALLNAAQQIYNKARANVTPGRGPGPHPHISKHVDTGALKASIFADIDVKENKYVVIVGNKPPRAGKINYGIVLETGSRFMPPYPWLSPAFTQAKRGGRKHLKKGKVAYYAAAQRLDKFSWSKAGIIYPPSGYAFTWPRVTPATKWHLGEK